MAVTPNPQNPQKPTKQVDFVVDPADVQRIDEMTMKWTNLLSIQGQIKKASKEQQSVYKEIVKLQGQELDNANKYSRNVKGIEYLEKNIQTARAKGNIAGLQNSQKLLKALKAQQETLSKTTGGALRAEEILIAKQKARLKAELDLNKAVNAERAKNNKLGKVGVAIADLFRSKEQKQRQIDIARAKAGGGANLPPQGGDGAGGAAGGGGGKGKAVGALAGLGAVGLLIAGIKAGIDQIKAPFQALGSLVKGGLTAPLAEASNLVSGGIGGGMGIGGGGISGAGATSLLGGFQDIISKVPVLGGLLGGLVGIFKGIVDLVLGIDQGITNFARNLGISKDRARAIRDEFRAVAKASDNIVVNDTRLLESQAELTKALGVRSEFSNDILQNNIKLKEIAGLELETRKAITQTSITTGRNAEKLTKSILAQSKAFEFETGVAFEFRDVLNQASKQAGVLGLIFTKNDKKLTDMLMRTKAMGFELKQLDGMASSFLDFESSITKEFEAQVLTGKQLNLTKAREAALNNDLVTLAKEINSQVGSSEDYLRMNRIQQEAIAEAVGMTRDGLADALKQQEYYRRLGATNLKQAQEELKVLKQRGLTQSEISKQIGEDAYNYITQTSTAERLTEVMNRIKTIFIEFVENSGILEFITNPQKIQGFVTGLINRLAGAVEVIGDIIATILEGISHLPFTDTAKWQGLATSVRVGTAGFAGGIRGAATTIQGMNFGEAAPSVGNTVQQGVRQQNSTAPTGAGSTGAVTSGNAARGMAYVGDGRGAGDVYLDGQKVGSIIFNKVANQVPGQNKT
jgi:hypothetical protein